MTDIPTIIEGLSEAQRCALMAMPLPCDAVPHRWIPARSFSSIWRKLAKHWDSLSTLEDKGIVERKVSRGETLWRPTRDLGLQVRAALEAGEG